MASSNGAAPCNNFNPDWIPSYVARQRIEKLEGLVEQLDQENLELQDRINQLEFERDS